jgi:hypothetical protein
VYGSASVPEPANAGANAVRAAKESRIFFIMNEIEIYG